MNIPYLQKEDMGDDEDSDGSYSHSQLPPKRGGLRGVYPLIAVGARGGDQGEGEEEGGVVVGGGRGSAMNI